MQYANIEDIEEMLVRFSEYFNNGSESLSFDSLYQFLNYGFEHIKKASRGIDGTLKELLIKKKVWELAKGYVNTRDKRRYVFRVIVNNDYVAVFFVYNWNRVVGVNAIRYDAVNLYNIVRLLFPQHKVKLFFFAKDFSIQTETIRNTINNIFPRIELYLITFGELNSILRMNGEMVKTRIW